MNRRFAKPLPPVEPVREGEACACRHEIVRQSDGVIVQQQATCLLHAAMRPKQPRRSNHKGRRPQSQRRAA